MRYIIMTIGILWGLTGCGTMYNIIDGLNGAPATNIEALAFMMAFFIFTIPASIVYALGSLIGRKKNV